MKKSCTGSWLLLFLLIAAIACKQQKKEHVHEQAQQYTCPMHPKVVQDKPGSCPLCGMDLVPMSSHKEAAVDSNLLHLLKFSNEQVISSVPTIVAESGTRIFSVPVQGVIAYDTRKQVSISSRVSGRIERLYVKYNYQPIKKGQLIMEIYSPDLAAAQRELIYISRQDNNPALLQRAKQRLALLGMQQAQIAQVIRTGQPSYRVPVYSSVSGYIFDQTSLSAAPATSTPMATTASSGGGGMDGMGGGSSTASATAQPQVNNAPVLVREGQYVNAGQSIFSVYEQSGVVGEFSLDPTLAAQVQRGQKMIYKLVAAPNEVYAGNIGLIEPAQRSGSGFTSVRVYLHDRNLQPGQLLAGNIPVVARGWWLPESAVVALGSKSIVFKKENEVFVPREVRAGMRYHGMVQVQENIQDWLIAKNASFMVDSESFIRLQENIDQ
ncbi:efflux RND transporter periplasmic adaptor subunit [Aridibaculum aurantiacum]|uniref:efflux RND transporter periplasmic adaptor subunit n=1 Tax=Aridibaculum aurantiacum TaxID=2810307 RepID=UPI001A965C73|nr:efflux RND transporter periplasmic adaptor subunit [Aridibaculum aurantiacum]